MKVIGVTEYGGPEALSLHEVPDPQPGPGEARIRVHAVAVSPTDTMLRAGFQDMADKQPPYVPGMDAAGVVDAVGEGSRWSVGDEVMTMAIPRGEHGGAYAELLVAPDDAIAKIPAGVGFPAASTLPMNGLTATQALERLALQPGDTLAVTGAAGVLGTYVIALAKQAGLTVVADAADKDRDAVLAMGADHVVARGDDVAARIREVFPDGVDALVDGSVQGELVILAVRDGGGIATVRFWKGVPGRDITFHRVSVGNEYHSGDKLDRLRQLAEDGTIPLKVVDVYPADQAAQAHERFERGGVRGRLVIDLTDV